MSGNKHMSPFIEHHMLRDAEGSTKQALSYLSDFIHIGSQYGKGSFYLYYTDSKTEAYVK